VEEAVEAKGSYRDAWRATKEQQNTLVFNFVGAKKDVSHIENDGLDLSSRGKGGKVQLAEAGESSDALEGEQGLVWVGAEVSTGKSSLRARGSAKKLRISFAAQPEVFEYPSFSPSAEEPGSPEEPCRPGEPQDSSRLKANTVVGSSGGLGSYTPSKIHLSDSPFQLGVSRTPAAPTATSSTAAAAAPGPTLVQADHGVSWGRAASSDMLF